MNAGVFRLFFAAAIVVAASQAAHAVLVKEGQSTPAQPQLLPVSGSLIREARSQFLTPHFSGILTARVYGSDTSNAYGGLTFTYQIETFPDSRLDIRRFSINGFVHRLTDFSYAPDTGEIVPSAFERDRPGSVVAFSFGRSSLKWAGLSRGTESDSLVIRTNADGYAYQVANISSGAVALVSTLGPAGIPTRIIPEPTLLAVLCTGLIARVRRR